jgi:hypothetical protein
MGRLPLILGRMVKKLILITFNNRYFLVDPMDGSHLATTVRMVVTMAVLVRVISTIEVLTSHVVLGTMISSTQFRV